jgi:putative N-acetylmannosamine-6-phosphate epimerase
MTSSATNHRFYDLEKSVAELCRAQQEVVARLAVIDRKLDLVAADATKMSAHVSFVESVYEQVKRPFHFLMGRANTLADSLGADSSLADGESVSDKADSTPMPPPNIRKLDLD